jgi:micrococcal nuclease
MTCNPISMTLGGGKLLTRYLVPITVLFTLGIIAALYWLSHNSFSGIVNAVHDGQTIQVYHNHSFRQIQLIGVDAPAMGEPFSQEARDHVQSLVGKKRVFVKVKGKGPDDLDLAEVFYLSGEKKLSLNRHLVQGGLARWDKAYRGDGHLQDLEQQAKLEKRGLWAQPLYHAATTTPQSPPQSSASKPPAVRNSTDPMSQGTHSTESVYRWVDDKGTVHFSDKPLRSGAEQVDVKPIATYTVAQAPPPQVVSDRRSPKAPAAQRPPPSFEGQINKGVFQTRGGYRVTANAKHFGEYLSFEGRVENGPPCRTLRLSGTLIDQKGDRQVLIADVSEAGSGSRLYESSRRRVINLKRGWEVISVQARCIQQ